MTPPTQQTVQTVQQNTQTIDQTKVVSRQVIADAEIKEFLKNYTIGLKMNVPGNNIPVG